jgi:mRNA-degrading endonuclease RelE of RelBE toxin-antitoxin system
MASYKVVPKPSVEKDLRPLSKSTIARVVKQLDALADNPFPRQAVKLEGGEGFYRIRVGGLSHSLRSGFGCKVDHNSSR